MRLIERRNDISGFVADGNGSLVSSQNRLQKENRYDLMVLASTFNASHERGDTT